jgi:hypothetical protein
MDDILKLWKLQRLLWPACRKIAAEMLIDLEATTAEENESEEDHGSSKYNSVQCCV